MGNKMKSRGGANSKTPKKKSVKAKITSTMNSTRRLSRMGKEQKKGMRGVGTEYMTRSQILKKLQISLKDFRRLCILKGIYPRDPPVYLSGKHRTYYHIKDVAFIAHEPLLNKFREFKTFMRKVRRAAGRKETSEARRLHQSRPMYTVDHLVKERYPTFADALRDIDDALCLVYMFAALPSERRILAEKTRACAQLKEQWQFYVTKTNSLKKVFVSVKGIYFQAHVQGQVVTWVQPHQFTPHLPAPTDVDYRVMLTFLEFYHTFLSCVLYKLYISKGWTYTPVLFNKIPTADAEAEADGGGADSAAVAAKGKENTESDEEEDGDGDGDGDVQIPQEVLEKAIGKAMEGMDVEASGAGSGGSSSDDGGGGGGGGEDGEGTARPKALLPDGRVDDDDAEADNNDDDGGLGLTLGPAVAGTGKKPLLFKGLVFFLNREVPVGWFTFIIQSFGGMVGFDDFGIATEIKSGRSKKSPFSVHSSMITHHIVDRPNLDSVMKAIGSSDVKSRREFIQPQWVLDSINASTLLPIHRYAVGKTLPPHLSPFVDDEKEGYVPSYKREVLYAQRKGIEGPSSTENDITAAPQSNETVEELEEDEVDKDKSKEESDSESENVDSESEEERKILAKTMMSKKSKRLYGRMQHGIEKKKARVAELEAKRRRIEDK